MKNNTMPNKLFRYFFSSLKQCFAYGTIIIVYYLCIMLILNNSQQITVWFGNTIEIFLPVLLTIGYSLFVLRKQLHCSIKNIFSKNSVCRFVVRLFAVFCFLFLGYLMDMKVHLPSFGELSYRIVELITNFNIYMIVVAFPTAFAVIEYAFVKPFLITTTVSDE